MGLEVIPNQPINIEPPAIDACNNSGSKTYCSLYKSTDYIYLQWKLTSCGDDLSCSPDIVGYNMITNGNFDTDLVGWNIRNSITWSASKMQFANTGGSQVAIWDFLPNEIIAGATYTVTFTISSRTAGSVTVGINGGTAPTFSTNATHSVSLVAGSTLNPYTGKPMLTITGSGTFDGNIDSVACYSESSCFTIAGNWSLSDNGYAHAQGSITELQMAITLVESTVYQEVLVTVIGMSAGSLSLFEGSTEYAPPISANGTYKYYFEQTGNFTINFTPSSDFNGTISAVHVHELHRDYSLVVTDASTGAFVYDATSDITYVQDRAIAKVLASDIGSEGCYKFNVVDPCLDLLTGVTTGEISPDVSFNTAGLWTVTDGGATSTGLITGGRLQLTTGATSAHNYVDAVSTANSLPPATGVYIFKYTIITGLMDSMQDPGANILISMGNTLWDTVGINNPLPSTTYTIYNMVPFDISNNTDFNIHIQCTNTTDAGEVNRLESVSVQWAEVDDVTSLYGYKSNCIMIDDTNTCLKLVDAYSDKVGEKLGFLFTDTTGTNFKLSHRLECFLFNPSYPTETKLYDYSDGSQKIYYAERQKYWDVGFNWCDETAHDTISAQIILDKFFIDSVEYVAKPEDYKPGWPDSNGKYDYSVSRIEVRKKNSTIYNRNI
jgi:hypothetical protein